MLYLVRFNSCVTSIILRRKVTVAAPGGRVVCSRLVAGITGSNPAEGIDVRLLCVLCRERLLRYADHSSRGVLPGVCVCVCVCVCDLETSAMRRPEAELDCCPHTKKKKKSNRCASYI